MKKNIIKDFTFSNKPEDYIKLSFLKKVSKTSVCVSKKTGLVFHNKFKSSSEVLEEWSNKIYNYKETDPKTVPKWIQKWVKNYQKGCQKVIQKMILRNPKESLYKNFR